MTYSFSPEHFTVDWIDPQTLGNVHELVRNEPMLFGCDLDSARKLGGPLTSKFLDVLGARYGWIIDSRVHMLMPDWYPCIPGWHHDDVPRDREDGQPDYDTPSYRSDHVMMIVDAGTGALTEFLNETVSVSPVPLGQVVYREWDAQIRALKPRTMLARNGDVISFSDHGFHRGRPATASGWRWFVRASRGTLRPALNEVRKQVQVYMPVVTAGW